MGVQFRLVTLYDTVKEISNYNQIPIQQSKHGHKNIIQKRYRNIPKYLNMTFLPMLIHDFHELFKLGAHLEVELIEEYVISELRAGS